jgi:hypothetical protein
VTDMYGRDSRYYRIGAVTRVDHAGRVLVVDELRRRQFADGTFRHTISADDRLDHLSQRYYGKPRRWWLIADANPEFASPLALLGDEPINLLEIGIALPDDIAWSKVMGALRDLAGVEDIALRPDRSSDAERSGVLTVRFNRATIDAEKVHAEAVRAVGAGAVTAGPVPVTRIGRQIVIPPDDVG